MNVDKNDVDISRLFQWKKKFMLEYITGQDAAEVYMRLAGDADINRARVHGLRKAADLRKKLITEDTDERIAFIPPIEMVDKEGLIQAIASLSIKEYSKDAVKELDLPYPVEPKSDATQEAWEKYQAEVDNYPNQRLVRISEYIKYAMDADITKLEKQNIEDLYKKYERLIITDLCEREMVGAYNSFCIQQNTFVDPEMTVRVYETTEEFENAPRFVKDQLLTFYEELELDSVELKK